MRGARAIRRALVASIASVAACGPSPSPPKAGVVPAGKTWFCFETVEVSLTTCSRTEDECERGHDISSGRCSLREAAWCFTAARGSGNGELAQCAGSRGDCTRIRGNLEELGDIRDASACVETR